MEVKKEEVVAETPPAEEVAVEAPVEQAVEPVVTPSETPEVKPEVKDNRPIENVAWETKRKIDELYPKVDKIFELIQQQGSQQPQQPAYSKAQLLTYAQTPEITTEQRLWAYGEVEKMEKEERKKEYENLVSQTRQNTEADQRRNQSTGWVAQSFPDMVVKDQMGNPIGWNNNHPLFIKANEYMGRSKALRDDPEGFMAAVKLAAFDLGVNVNKQLSQKVDRTIGQLRKEQKKQLASAGGTRSSENPANASQARYEKLKETYAKTGKREVFDEMVRMKGLNPFV